MCAGPPASRSLPIMISQGAPEAWRVPYSLPWGGELTYNREYNRVGMLKLGGKSYSAVLVDQNVTGRFNDFKHADDEPAKVLLVIDRNGDGTFDIRRGAFDVAKPFRLGGSVYER